MRNVRLHVNVDHVATIRQARGTSYPDPVGAASLAELAGADGITVHLREDRRHIQDRDVRLLRQTVRTLLNLEMAATSEIVRIACEVKPDMATLVPERREERTTEGGLDLGRFREAMAGSVRILRDSGITVSLFVDPELDVIRIAREIGGQLVELHTGDYCAAPRERVTAELARLARAADGAAKLGLRVAAGHGLDYPNVAPVAALHAIEELNIGHAIVARALFHGMERAVRDMLDAIRVATTRSDP